MSGIQEDCDCYPMCQKKAENSCFHEIDKLLLGARGIPTRCGQCINRIKEEQAEEIGGNRVQNNEQEIIYTNSK